ncbi:uncharacterized protein PG998_014539, partial [Apiospora kogelbergensis]|uniref:uncharacterized protein n=1 Tax=Apiospora kogelbergensis TaxID=1337665 RepID=UPI00312E553F
EYSDLIISCGGTDHRVHRSIVCPRSDFFAAACRNGFNEAKEGKISLSDDDDKAVDFMIYYLYNLNYHPSYPREQSENDLERKENNQAGLSEGLQPIYPHGNELIIHTKVYVLAEKYLINGLKALALLKFNEATIEHSTSNALLEATQVAYQSTVETDKG